MDNPSSSKTSAERTGASVSAGLLARGPMAIRLTSVSLGTHVLNGAFYSLPYDVLNDFAPISPLVTTPFVLFARKTMPAKDLNELIAWLKANPNKASAAVVDGGVPSCWPRSFRKKPGRNLLLCPYRGSAPAMQDLVAGQIDLYFAYTGSAAAGAGREHKSLCGDKRHALGAGTRHPDLCRDGTAGAFLLRLVSGFSRPRARRGTSSASSMRRPWRRWPIRRCDRGSSISGWRFSRANNRRRRRSARL